MISEFVARYWYVCVNVINLDSLSTTDKSRNKHKHSCTDNGCPIIDIAEVVLQTKVFKICCFNCAVLSIFCRSKAQFYTLKLTLLHLAHNFDKYRPALANYLGTLFLSKIAKKCDICIVL